MPSIVLDKIKGISLSSFLVTSFREAQAELVVQTADLPLGTLADMVRSGGIDLEPGFQRRERWSVEKQSALIESFLLNVPVPPVYLSEEQDGRYTAIDGKQRLRAISDFINNEFKLRNLENMEGAEGAYFYTLPDEIKNAFKLRPFLRVVTLLKQTDPLLKYEVFLRLNRGGEALNAQEIRNVAFRGELNDLIYELAKNTFLCRQLKIDDARSAAFRDMADAEYVLRFLALEENYERFSGNLVRSMDDYMRKYQAINRFELDKIECRFKTAVERVEKIWGAFAFRRPEGAGWRDQTLAGMYDAQMIAVSRLDERSFNLAFDNKDDVIIKTRRLFEDLEFDKSVRSGTNTPARIRYRIENVYEALKRY